MAEQPRLETERLVLRSFSMDDAADVQRLAGAAEVALTTLNVPHPYEDGLAEDWISQHRAQFEAGQGVNYAVTLKETGELVGAMGLVINERHNRAEMGYWIGVPYWNRGYGTEAARALVTYGFETLGLNRIHATHFTRNPASGRIMQKLGMHREGQMRQHVRKGDTYEDLVLYGLLRDEW
jgi:RimJ/RimL family protein N-acetyltransferase